jgi:hypothetical protein
MGMRIGIVSVFVDYHRRGRKNRLSLQPQIGPLIAALLPREAEIEIVNETARDLDWRRDYDLLFISALHSDFDRARQVSHYWRRRGAKTVIGGAFATSFPQLCQPWFDAVVVGDPEGAVPRLYRDFAGGNLASRYTGEAYDASNVPTPRFDLLAGQAHHPLCFEATRGCPFTCEFCVLTGLGTRYHTRPAKAIVRDILAGQSMLEGLVPAIKRRVVGFCDNNIGGNLAFLRELCGALRPLRVQWYASATFNVIANPELVRLMSSAGCRALFVGLESFNQAALTDMRKYQNSIRKTRAALRMCNENGILVASGLLVSPLADDPGYIRRIPEHLAESGLGVPTFLSIESPIPGTPHFRRLAAESEPAFLPDALLRDFAGYTLVTRPRRASVEEFVGAYRDAVERTFSARRRALKVAREVPGFLVRGHWFPAMIDAVDMATIRMASSAPSRTYIAGTDGAPPERVPFEDSDFNDENERLRMLEPWRVTDGAGRLLPQWSGSRQTYAMHSASRDRAAIAN